MTFKERANEMLSEMGQKMPVSKNCKLWWGEVELPECLRKELEESERDEQ